MPAIILNSTFQVVRHGAQDIKDFDVYWQINGAGYGGTPDDTYKPTVIPATEEGQADTYVFSYPFEATEANGLSLNDTVQFRFNPAGTSSDIDPFESPIYTIVTTYIRARLGTNLVLRPTGWSDIPLCLIEESKNSEAWVELGNYEVPVVFATEEGQADAYTFAYAHLIDRDNYVIGDSLQYRITPLAPNDDIPAVTSQYYVVTAVGLVRRESKAHIACSCSF